ncbi:MAG: hypothetical protein ACE5LB_06335 [Acidiferrobacterales bacterium]
MDTRAKISPGARSTEGSATCLSRSVSKVLVGTFLALLVTIGLDTAVAQGKRFPLDPPDTASPRGTLFNLIDNIAEAHRVLDAAARDYKSTPGLFKSTSVLEQEARVEALLRRAAESLDLSQVPPAIRRHVSLEPALQLKEVLDRVSCRRPRPFRMHTLSKRKGLPAGESLRPVSISCKWPKAPGPASSFSTPGPWHERRECTRP